MIGTANGYRVSITGIGANVPERVLTNEELVADGRHVGRVDRRAHRDPRAAHRPRRTRRSPTWRFRPRGRRSTQAGVAPAELDLVIVATVTPDMAFPATAALIADELGAPRGGRLRPLRRLHRLHVRGRAGVRDAGGRRLPARARGRRRRALEDRRLVGPHDLHRVRRRCRRGRAWSASSAGGFLGFELGADGSGGMQLYLPAGGSRAPTSARDGRRATSTSCA